MKNTFYILIFISFSRQLLGQTKVTPIDTGYYSYCYASPKDKIVRRTIWTTFFVPLLKQQKDSVINYVDFPLSGDWGYIMGYKKSTTELKKTDFIKGYDKLFTEEFIRTANRFSECEIIIRKHDGWTEYVFEIGFSKVVDGMKHESGLFLKFKKIKGVYKLYTVQAVG